MSLSKIVVSGKVVKAPEKRFTPTTNMAVTEFAIQVELQPRNDGRTETSVIKVFVWRELAERCAQEIKKGDLVVVDGRMQINNYSTADGHKRRDVEIEAIAVENFSEAGSTQADSPDNSRVAQYSAARSNFKQATGDKGEDLDAIFASEEEIPF